MNAILRKAAATWLAMVMSALLVACGGSGGGPGGFFGGLPAGGGEQGGGGAPPDPATPQPSPPNILFVIMDDVGVDQMASFGYGGNTPPPMPNIDAVADAGIRFRNTWSMPECSPGRAAFFVGRYPLRTGMYQALGPNDLANSQLSPHDVTVPKLLKAAGYDSAMFGKFHLAGPEHNAAGNTTPAQLGWDYFYGWVGGLPGSIDTSAGGVHDAGEPQACGFYPHHFAGSCSYADNTCENMAQPALSEDSSGLQCLTKGGIFVKDHVCGQPLPQGVALDFSKENAYYVSPLVIVENGKAEEVPLTDPRARGYRTTIETDAAVRWIRSRPANKPWMATVSYSAAHTPWQHAPKRLSPQTSPHLSGNILDCGNTVAGRVIQNQMTEAMDTEFGRLMVETGLAQRGEGGHLAYDPQASNTVVVIVGDNGTLGYAAKLPFDPTLAKGTSYQTGVWVPLIVAGPQVAQPGREVEHMVNSVDLFQFFGELAGVDARKAVPRTIDGVGLLPYLRDVGAASLRSINFTQSGMNLQADGGSNGPCVMNRNAAANPPAGGSCTQIPTAKSVCEDNGGVWWGGGYTDASVVPNGGTGYVRCWEVNKAIHLADPSAPKVSILPESSAAIRDPKFKIVRNTVTDYDAVTNTAVTLATEELYEVDQSKGTPRLEDPAGKDLLKQPPLSDEARSAYVALKDKLDDLLASEPDCPGDGNKDGVVDAKDEGNWHEIARDWGLSSVYDFVVAGVLDGRTDAADGQIVAQNLGKTCPKSHGVY
ncbi:sulfatase-like hydrolase/transferase [Xenophilus azovorans]|uniref:sulfatase-like hydrolase/transferase n=1 Tax=Xenophilus azovorans TaxID=151755 RepID=UPI000A44E6B3|nr:sulfatase-like hydrolase/transferase [Xenophilus azovorans]